MSKSDEEAKNSAAAAKEAASTAEAQAAKARAAANVASKALAAANTPEAATAAAAAAQAAEQATTAAGKAKEAADLAEQEAQKGDGVDDEEVKKAAAGAAAVQATNAQAAAQVATQAALEADKAVQAPEMETQGPDNPDISETLDATVAQGDHAPALKPPSETTYDQSKYHDTTRSYIAYWLLFLLTLLIVCGFGSLFVAQTVTFENIKNILEVIFGPVIALVSAATGFYFGAQQPNKK